MTTITADRIKETLSYDPETGSITWKARTSHWDRTGKEAGTVPAGNGYRYISLDLDDVLAQRAIWVLMTGDFPKGRLTFKDGNRLNLKWDNIIENVPMCKAKFNHRTPEGKSAYGKEWRAANPKKTKERELKRVFGLTLRQYEDMLLAQQGKCAICDQRETAKRGGKELSLCVDHNHKTGAIRELLCRGCNQGIGNFLENPELLKKAISYIEKHKESNVIPLISEIKHD